LKEEEERAANGNDFNRDDILTISREDASQVNNNRSTKNRFSGKIVRTAESKEALTPKSNTHRMTTRRSNVNQKPARVEKDDFIVTKTSTPTKKVGRKSSLIKTSTPAPNNTSLDKSIAKKQRPSQNITSPPSLLAVRRSLRTPQKRDKDSDFYSPSLAKRGRTSVTAVVENVVLESGNKTSGHGHDSVKNQESQKIQDRQEHQGLRSRRATAMAAHQNIMKSSNQSSEAGEMNISYHLTTRSSASKGYPTRKQSENKKKSKMTS